MANEPTDALVAGEYSAYPPYDKLNATHVQEACLNLEYDDIIDNAISEEFQHCLVDSPLLQIDINLAEDIWARSLLQNSPDSIAHLVNIDGEGYEPKDVIRAYINKAKTAQNNNQGGNNNMPNVMFKRGTNADLNTKVFNISTNTAGSNGVQDGAFYLTTDTHRLYVGQSNTLVELNKSITVVDSVADLPTSGVAKGQFYYINGINKHEDTSTGGENGNILAVCTHFENGVAKWTQVNPDTNVNDHLKSVSVTKGAKVNNQIPYTLTFQMADRDNQNLENPPTVTFYVNAADIIELADVNVNVGSVDSNKTVTVTTKLTDGTNSSSGDVFKIKGGTNVTLTKTDDDTIEIDTGISTGSIQNKVTYASNKVTQKVQVNSTDSGDELNLSGEKGITISTAGKIGHTNNIAAGSGTADTDLTLTNGGNFTAVTNVTYDAQGHITSEKYKKITLPTIQAYDIDVDSTDKGKLKFALKDQENNAGDYATSANSILFYDITVDGTKVTKTNQDDLGSFYSKDAIDRMMRSLDAFTYQGPITSANSLPDGSAEHPVHNGDTYKVNSNAAITINGQTANPGDLVVAVGTENENGVLSTPIQWSVIAGGTNTDTTYKTKVQKVTGNNNAANVGIIAEIAGSEFTKYTTVSGDTWITVTPTEGEDSAGKLAFSHKGPGAASGGTFGNNTTTAITPGNGGTLNVPKITKDNKGHIVSIEDVQVTIPAAMKLEGNATDDTVFLKDANSGNHGSIKFSGDDLIGADLTIKTGDASTNTLTVSHKAPAGIKADGSTSTGTGSIKLQTDNERTASIITAINRDDKGHVKDYTTTTLTFDKIDYSLSRTVASNSATIALKDQSNGDKGQVVINSTSLKIESSSTNAIKMDIVWEGF